LRCSLNVGLAATAALALKLTLAFNTYGTNDVIIYEQCLKKARTEGGMALIRDGVVYPRAPRESLSRWQFTLCPFMIPVLHGWGWLGDHTGLPFRFWLRATSALADAASVFLVLKMIQPAVSGLLLIALSPVSIFIAGFHGSTDPIHVALTLLAVFVTQRYRKPWLSGALFALAMSVKVVPLIYIPALVFFFPDARRRLEFLLALGATFLAGCLPYVAQDPILIYKQLFGYTSQFGFWGFPRLLTLLSAAVPAAHTLTLIYYALGRFAVLGAVAYFSWKHRNSAAPLFTRVAFIAAFFMTFIPAFGIQYLAWLIPWTAAARVRASLAFHLIGGVFVASVYTYWSGGMPWYLADAISTGMWRGPLIGLELVTWAIVFWMWLQLREPLKTPAAS
jgi:hypothetical protein